MEQLIGSQNIKVYNRGVSGDTTYTLLNRLVFSLKPTPDIAFIAIGANDGLRGMPAMNTKQNISQMITILKHKQIRVILAGMTLPQNYTKSYIQSFENVFPDLAKEYQIPIMPFLLTDVAGVPTLNLADGIHPNKAGHKKIAESIQRFLKEENLISSQNQWLID